MVGGIKRFLLSALSLEVISCGKLKLFDEHSLERRKRVLFIEEQCGVTIIFRFNGSERNRTVFVCNQQSIANDSFRSFVSVFERLNVSNEEQRD